MISEYIHEITQSGAYVTLTDKSTWPIGSADRDDYVDCMVVEKDTATLVALAFRDEPSKAFLSDVGQSYNIRMYGAPIWVSGTFAAGDVVDDIPPERLRWLYGMLMMHG